LSFNQKLNYNTQTDNYELINYNFGQKNIGEGAGQDFIISGIGNNGAEFTIGTSRFIRVIDKRNYCSISLWKPGCRSAARF
jgi:hypothetical protein